jgi:hypothetical protein
MAIEKVIDIKVQSNADAAVGSLRSQLREAQADVSALSEKFGATSIEAINAAKKAGELKDKIGDAKALTDAFNPDAKFKALSSSLGGVAGGFAAVQGGMALFGKQSEDVEKTLLKVQSAMALSQGLQSVGESIDSFKQLGAVLKSTSAAQKVMTAVTAAYTFVTEAATGGLKLFRLALVSTGIGAIVIGLGLLVANFGKVKDAVMNLIPGLKSVGDFFGGIVNSVTDFVGATSDASRALDRLKSDADKTLQVNKKFMTEHGDQLDQYTKRKLDAKNAYAEALKEDGANQVALAKRLNRELAKADEDRQAEKNKKSQENKDKENAARKTAEEERVAAIMKEREKIKPLENELSPAGIVSNNTIKVLEANKITENLIANDTTEQKKIRAEQEAEFEKNKAEAIANTKKNLDNIMQGIEASGLAKTKAGQAISKAIALTQIGIDSAVAISKATTLANAEGVAAQLAFPMVPAAGTIARVVSYASTAASVISNIARAKQLLSSGGTSGGGGGGSTAPGGGGGGGGGMTAPQFNIVGNTGVNQLAQTLGQEQAPIKTYVTAGDVTTGQSLNRNIITNASLG